MREMVIFGILLCLIIFVCFQIWQRQRKKDKIEVGKIYQFQHAPQVSPGSEKLKIVKGKARVLKKSRHPGRWRCLIIESESSYLLPKDSIHFFFESELF